MDEFAKELHDKMAPLSNEIISTLYEGTIDDDPQAYQPLYDMLGDATEKKSAWLHERIAYWKAQVKVVGLWGGDHRCPIAYHQQLHQQGVENGILHAEAHSDLREAFERFKYSHSSIFYNTLNFDNMKKLVQVGIRDYYHQKKALAENQPNRIIE